MPLMLPNLRALQLSNVTLDMRCPLQMACAQWRRSKSKIAIHMNGTIIFYGLTSPLFFDLLDRLGIEMQYDPLKIFPYTHFRTEDVVPSLHYTLECLRLESCLPSVSWADTYKESLRLPKPLSNSCKTRLLSFRTHLSDLNAIVRGSKLYTLGPYPGTLP